MTVQVIVTCYDMYNGNMLQQSACILVHAVCLLTVWCILQLSAYSDRFSSSVVFASRVFFCFQLLHNAVSCNDDACVQRWTSGQLE